ncbi:MAG: hypothetical protein ACLGIN_01055, partial [Candidatus Sericytochromatia bacterium]
DQLAALAVFMTFFPQLFHEIVLAGMRLYVGAIALERLMGRTPVGRLYHMRWDADGVTVEAGGGTHTYPTSQIHSVVWEPIHWYGTLSRDAVALGGVVRLDLVGGNRLIAGSGLDNLRLRQLAEALAHDLNVPMVEKLTERPLVRQPEQLDKPVTGSLRQLPRQWRQMPRYANWKVDRTAWKTTLSIGGGAWKGKAMAEVFDHYGAWLMPVLLFDIFRFPLILLAGTFGRETTGFLDFDAWEIALHTFAAVPLIWGLRQAHKRRVLTIDRERLTYEVEGEPTIVMPASALEQVRHETFPDHTVRLIGDFQEIVIEHLPSQVDYEALADQLPHLLPEAPVAEVEAQREG